MRKNPIRQNGPRPTKQFDRTATKSPTVRRLRPVTCIAIGLSVLYLCDRSTASMFDSDSTKPTGLAAIESTIQKWWQTAAATIGSADASKRTANAPGNTRPQVSPAITHNSADLTIPGRQGADLQYSGYRDGGN